MNSANEREINQTAYRQLKEVIRTSYPPGRLVAIAGGRIVADSDSFPSLFETITALGLKPPEVLVVQTGAEPPDYVDILLRDERS
jgi:hypothetical protein